MVYIFLADGFEESEALVPLDILRRGKIDTVTVGIGKSEITGSHGITVKADISENELLLDSNTAGIILPGGMPGTLNLEKSGSVQRAIDFANEKGLLIGAICAAPSVLGHKGLLKGKKATCFPGFEKDLEGAILSEKSAVTDGNIITAKGAGAAFDFGFAILSKLKSEKIASELACQMQYIK